MVFGALLNVDECEIIQKTFDFFFKQAHETLQSYLLLNMVKFVMSLKSVLSKSLPVMYDKVQLKKSRLNHGNNATDKWGLAMDIIMKISCCTELHVSLY